MNRAIGLMLVLSACGGTIGTDDVPGEDSLTGRALTFSLSGASPPEPRRSALALVQSWGMNRFDWWATDEHTGTIAAVASAFQNLQVPLAIAFTGRMGARVGDTVIDENNALADLDAVLAMALAHKEQRFGWAEDDAAELENLKHNTFQNHAFVQSACEKVSDARGKGAHFNLDLYGYCYDGTSNPITDDGYDKLVTLVKSAPAGCVAEVTLFVRTLEPAISPMWADATSATRAQKCVDAVRAKLPAVKVNVGVFTEGYRPTDHTACLAGQLATNGRCEIASSEAIHNVELARSVDNADGFTFMQPPWTDTSLANYFVGRFTGNGPARFLK